MEPPTVLVLGASGMLGRAVWKRLRDHDLEGKQPDWRVVGTGHSRAAALGLQELDVADDGAALDALLAEVQPAVVINCVVRGMCACILHYAWRTATWAL